MRESIRRIKEMVVQEAHKPGCACGFCKNKGKIHHIVNGGSKAKKEQEEEPEDPSDVQEGQDDIDKLGLPKAAVKYARMTKGDAMSGKKPQMYIDSVAAVTNQENRKKGFGIEDKGETTAGKKLESRVRRTVARLLAD